VDDEPLLPVDNPADPVKDALAAARELSRRAGRSLPRRRWRPGTERGASDRGEPRYSGSRPDDRDPQPVGALLRDVVDTRGWQRPLANARVFAEWAALVGHDVAAHCTPSTLRGGELRITAESTAWATQLRLLSAAMLQRLRAELGPDVVSRLIITGPAAPSWRHGRLSRPGRGPRDTYG
jgi:predicted nucleic acid-binding Zn ribbon protein